MHLYKTELMEEILKSPKAQEIVQMVSPIYGEAYTALWLFQVIGVVLDDVVEWAENLAKQTVPQTATWSLPYWEEEYCIIPDPSWSMEQRRQNIINRRSSRAPMNPAKMEKIVSAASGMDARVEELTGGKNVFTVYISGKQDLVNEDFVKQEINRAKQANLIYNIVYERYIASTSYTGGVFQISKEITLSQL